VSKDSFLGLENDDLFLGSGWSLAALPLSRNEMAVGRNRFFLVVFRWLTTLAG
jgi:hypothetical protein